MTEYEQLVLSAPNSSFVWIKYFAFLISLGELDKARSLADRALQSINYRWAGPLAKGGAAAGRCGCSRRKPGRVARGAPTEK